MPKRIDEYKTIEGADYKLWSENLEKEFSAIFKKCTMTGEAHAQTGNLNK